MRETTRFNPTITITNAGVTYLYDTTTSPGAAPVAGDNPGPSRDRFTGGRTTISATPTGEDVTLYLEELSIDSTGAETWTIANGAGSGEVITAGDTLRVYWAPAAPNHRARIVNGATGPTTLDVTVFWTLERAAVS